MRNYDKFRCVKCGRSYSGYIVQPTPSIDDNKCAACGFNILIVHLKLLLEAYETCVPAEEAKGLWSTHLNQVTVGSNIRRARIARRLIASRRLERQRRREVPALVLGFVDITSNWYTGCNISAVTKRSSASDLTADAKRSRRSPSTSTSITDNEEPYDS